MRRDCVLASNASDNRNEHHRHDDTDDERDPPLEMAAAMIIATIPIATVKKPPIGSLPRWKNHPARAAAPARMNQIQ